LDALLDAERIESLRRIANRLPKPLGHILLWRALHSWSHAQVREAILRFRPVSLARVKFLGRAAVAMARRLAEGGVDAEPGPKGVRRRKNPWKAIPLPSLASL
jgi:hypothetical protein